MRRRNTFHCRAITALCVAVVGVMVAGCSHSDEAANSSAAASPSKGGVKAGAGTAGPVPGAELKVGSKLNQ